MNNKMKIYLASGNFTVATESSLRDLERYMSGLDYINLYSPFRDGIKLAANEFHDHKMRKMIFLENVHQIKCADFLVVNLDGTDGHYDTGTCWELGNAMANHTPVIIYDPTKTVTDRFKSTQSGFYQVCYTLEELGYALERAYKEYSVDRIPKSANKLLFVGPDTTEVQRSNNEDIIASVILESHGDNFKWVDASHPKLQENIEAIFKDVDYMVAVIDDRHPIVSWMMGQAFERDIPIISFTNYDYGANIMLACSILTHCKGKEALKSVIQKIKREGFASFSEYDTSNMRAY